MDHLRRTIISTAVFIALSVLISCTSTAKSVERSSSPGGVANNGSAKAQKNSTEQKSSAEAPAKKVDAKKIIFAGGSFWCMQPPFDELKGQGVIATQVGFSGGTLEKPTYEEVLRGKSGHYEVIEVTYDAHKISLETILETYWKNIDPYDVEGQFCDKGEQYTSAVFYNTEEEKSAIEKSRLKVQELATEKGQVVTKILPAKEFFKAEESHQAYYLKNPSKFKYYKFSCGRDDRLKKIWTTK